jgi:hypothetical protein
MIWLLVAVACGGTETGNPTRGVHMCKVDRDCLTPAQRTADALSQPTTALTFTQSSCDALGSTDGGVSADTSCTCTDGKSAITLSTATTMCPVVGRARDCLYDAANFSGCDPTSRSCEAACTDIQALLDADAARVLSVSVHSAVCEAEVCRAILSIEGRCFVDQSTLAHDCSLSTSEILSRETQGIP